jgi:hypothetical protein
MKLSKLRHVHLVVDHLEELVKENGDVSSSHELCTW